MQNAVIQKLNNCSSVTVLKYRSVLLKHGIVKPDSEKYPIFLQSIEAFKDTPPIVRLVEEQLLHDGKKTENVIRSLYKICRTINIDPALLVIDQKSATLQFIKFEILWKKTRQLNTLIEYRKAFRKLLVAHNIIVDKKNTILSYNRDPRGDYSRVFLTDKEFDDGLDFLLARTDVRYAVAYAIQHETFTRTRAILNWIPNISWSQLSIPKVPIAFEYGEASIFESKQQKSYDKLIVNPRVIKLAKELPVGQTIFNKDHPLKVIAKYADSLREYYASINKIEIRSNTRYPINTNEWYYANRPIYSLRHSGAVMWMRRTGFNAGLVSIMGWESSNTLTKYYAKVSVKNLMQQGICFWCNPPMLVTGDKLFCSPSHAIAYFGSNEKSLLESQGELIAH